MIIMISGKAEAGKSTFANTIAEVSEALVCAPSRIGSFGTAVKKVALSIGWDGIKDERGRELLQFVGDGARQYNPNIWIEKMIDEVCRISQGYSGLTCLPLLVIDDARYINEIESFKSKFPKVISVRIERPNHQNRLTLDQRMNGGEVDLDDYNFDYVIINDGTKKDLDNKAIEFLKDVYSECPQ